MIKVYRVCRKERPVNVIKMKVGNLHAERCSWKFKEMNLDPESEVYVKTDVWGQIEYRGQQGRYSLFSIEHHKLYNTKCETFSHIKDGEPVMKPKRKFDTLDDAITECKKINNNIKQIHKVVSYKCNTCGKYHIGKNKTELEIQRKSN